MRFLCLHGRGTNGEVFEFQTAEAFRHLLPDNYSYTFPDGEHDCPAAPGVEKLIPGPYLCWYSDDSLKSIAEQHEVVSEIIEDEGPFDVVMGFSQGAALAASIILHHQIEQPLSPPLFRAAVFISSFRPFSRDPSLGVDITEDPGTYAPPSAKEGLARCRWMDPAVTKARIQIPTAHIYGDKDEFLNQALELVKLSEMSLASTFVHQGGHDIPVRPDVCKGIRDAIVTAVDQSCETVQ
ncbi:hypothetical protein MMC08_001598 [Hypocenomyce scalaris]|nr:hypothetical protein [Hypocenomyce scalaris]